jgi:beta-phosphoglucomutase-like phosphatase (HAD superfamily)
MSRAHIVGVALDVDGTLVDSNDGHARAWVEAFEEFGVHTSLAEVRPLIGMGGDRILDLVAGLGPDDPGSKAIDERRLELFRTKHLPAVRAFPEVPAFVARLHDERIAAVVASAAAKEDLARLLEIAGVPELADGAVSTDAVPRSKPAPDVVCAALERLALPARQVVMIGDTPWDIQAATRAGIGAIALRSGGWNDDGLVDALAIYDEVAHLLRCFDVSPLGTPRAQAAG